jgi:hypothetical protein
MEGQWITNIRKKNFIAALTKNNETSNNNDHPGDEVRIMDVISVKKKKVEARVHATKNKRMKWDAPDNKKGVATLHVDDTDNKNEVVTLRGTDDDEEVARNKNEKAGEESSEEEEDGGDGDCGGSIGDASQGRMLELFAFNGVHGLLRQVMVVLHLLGGESGFVDAADILIGVHKRTNYEHGDNDILGAVEVLHVKGWIKPKDMKNDWWMIVAGEPY